MVDTKVINDLTKTHSQKCFICLRSGKMLNAAMDEIDCDDPEKYKYGGSPLHAYMRSMEMLLKIAYRLAMKKPTWKVSKTNMEVKERETVIHDSLKERLELRISEPYR